MYKIFLYARKVNFFSSCSQFASQFDAYDSIFCIWITGLIVLLLIIIIQKLLFHRLEKCIEIDRFTSILNGQPQQLVKRLDFDSTFLNKVKLSYH